MKIIIKVINSSIFICDFFLKIKITFINHYIQYLLLYSVDNCATIAFSIVYKCKS